MSLCLIWFHYSGEKTDVPAAAELESTSLTGSWDIFSRSLDAFIGFERRVHRGPSQHHKHNQTFLLQNCIRGLALPESGLETVELAGIGELLLPAAPSALPIPSARSRKLAAWRSQTFPARSFSVNCAAMATKQLSASRDGGRGKERPPGLPDMSQLTPITARLRSDPQKMLERRRDDFTSVTSG